MTSDSPHTPARRAAVIFVFITVMLDMLAFGIIIPVFPHLVQHMTGGDIGTAVRWTGIMGALFGLMQFVFSPVQGAMSDRFGRRPVILASNLSLGFDFILMALAQTLPILFIGRMISGVASASISTANAYIADVTSREKRAAAYGLLGAAFGIGFIIGPALGGFLGGISVRAPFWVAAGLALANFLYGFFVLPESLPRERRSARFDLKNANPLGALRMLRRYPQVLALAVVFFLVALAQFSLNSTFVLYADYRYHWGPQEVGYTLALVGVCSAIVQAGMVRRVVPRFGERPVMLAGLLFGISGFLTLGFAANAVVFVLAIPLLALAGLGGPTTQAIITRQVDPTEQGRLQGAITSLASLATVFGPFVFSQIFAFFIGPTTPLHLPGAAFVLSAILLGLGFVLGWRATADLQPIAANAEPTAPVGPRQNSDLAPLAELESKP
ncbi:TCR/Tet family MFS transporter [Dokdonella immobilis]|uniref:MFS transporter, DHA1 family, tetracycline resistance protein n=1 Tax=Dokdonella immobilis TaxID=578942 RepID=A0A1I5B6L4_9GAMM|nr:TCR/Tet family MFS transporter [Dokdonella immobilis]SFN70343.1 MFS transporter, DHA1 family, tetracycline resistance protein [Dokdonella immobilis]